MSILDNFDFALYGPASVGLVDLFRTDALLQEPTENPHHDTVNNMSAVSECGSEKDSDSLEPETARYINTQGHDDHFDFEFESQLDHTGIPGQSQKDFGSFSPLSPLSPIAYRSSQSPSLTRDGLAKVSTSVYDQRHEDDNEDDNEDEDDNDTTVCMHHSVDISALTDHSFNLDDDNDDDNLDDDDGKSKSNSKSNSNADDLSEEDIHSPSPSFEDVESKRRPSLESWSPLENDTFQDSSDISINFTEKCQISDSNDNLVGDHQKSRGHIVPTSHHTNSWTLPLNFISTNGDKTKHRGNSGRQPCKKQSTLCSHQCVAHSHSHSDQSSDLHSTHDTFDMTHSDDTVSRALSDRLDTLNTELQEGCAEVTSLICSYYHQQTHKIICDILLQKSFQCHRATVDRRKSLTSKRSLVGGVLVVTSKKDISFWENLINCDSGSEELMTGAKIHCYTDSLSKRRKFGAFRIASHDIVFTTFDILRSKEVALPMDEGDTSSDDDDDHNEINGHARKKSGHGNQKWLTQRKRISSDTNECSNLHLIHWDRVVVDHRNITNIRCGTARGDAIMSLKADSHVSVVEQESEELPLPTHMLQDLSDFLNIRSDVLSAAYGKYD